MLGKHCDDKKIAKAAKRETQIFVKLFALSLADGLMAEPVLVIADSDVKEMIKMKIDGFNPSRAKSGQVWVHR